MLTLIFEGSGKPDRRLFLLLSDASHNNSPNSLRLPATYGAKILPAFCEVQVANRLTVTFCRRSSQFRRSNSQIRRPAYGPARSTSACSKRHPGLIFI